MEISYFEFFSLIIVLSVRFNIVYYLDPIRSDLEVVLTSMFDNLFHPQCSDPKPGSHLEVVEVFINAAISTSDSMSFEDFRKWCTLLPAVRKYLGSLFMPSDSGF